MSYILDALKRAEAERNGALPARPALPASFAPPPAAPARGVRLLLVLGLGAGALLGAFALNMWRSDATVAPATPATAIEPKTQTPSPTQQVAGSAAATTTPRVARAEEEANMRADAPPAAIILPPPGQAKAQAKSASGEAARAPATQAAAKPAPSPQPSLQSASVAPHSTVSTAAKAPASTAPGTLRDLPEDLQREIPPLAISGFLYAANPADRSVLINNRLRREGDEVAPGLVLESLQQNGMVLNYRGHRYRSTY